MRELAINRCLSEDTRKKVVSFCGEMYALHCSRDEYILTDLTDYTKIYGVFSIDCLSSDIMFL